MMMDDDENDVVDEETEEREPQVTSADPNERKFARKLRIERRLEAIRKLNMQDGEEEEEEVQKTLLQQQLQKSYELLEKLTIDGNEYVTNVRVANDSREVDRREVEGIGREKIIEQLEEEAASAGEQFYEIADKWLAILEYNDPLHIHEDIISQREKCDELIRQKDEVIVMLRNQIRTAELDFAKDQQKQNEDILTLTRRIDRQISLMRRAYRQELQLIDDVIMIERKILIDSNDRKWEELHKRRDQAEVMNSDKKFEQLEEFEEICTQLRIDHQETYRETKIKLEHDIEGLERELEDIKTLALMNSEKLDYNYQILKKREDENIIIKSQQKRRMNKLQDGINTMRKRIREYTAKTNNDIERFTGEVRKLHASVLDIEAKADHFSRINDVTYKQLWELNRKTAAKVLNNILTTDRVLYDQQLGLNWVNPEQTVLEKTDLPSYISAMQIVTDLFKKESDAKDKTKTSTEKIIKEESAALPLDGETIARRRILRLVLKLIADKSGFLIEERLKDILKPYVEHEKNIIRVDAVFAALTIKRAEDVDILFQFFLPYTHCPICSKLPGTTVSVESSETELKIHSFNKARNVSESCSTSSAESLLPSEISSDSSPPLSVFIDGTDIMSAIHQPNAVIDQIISNLTEFATNVHATSCETCDYDEIKPQDEMTRTSETINKSVVTARTSMCKTSKSTTSTTSSKLSCQNRHPLVISSVYILRALREFVSKFYVPIEGIVTMTSRLFHKRSTVSRLLLGDDVKLYWDSFKNMFSPSKEALWDGLMIGLQKYHEILKDRKKLNDEVVALRQQNMELKYLLMCYKTDEKKKLDPPCALQREHPIRPTQL